MEDWLKCQISTLVKYRQNQTKTKIQFILLLSSIEYTCFPIFTNMSYLKWHWQTSFTACLIFRRFGSQRQMLIVKPVVALVDVSDMFISIPHFQFEVFQVRVMSTVRKPRWNDMILALVRRVESFLWVQISLIGIAARIM